MYETGQAASVAGKAVPVHRKSVFVAYRAVPFYLQNIYCRVRSCSLIGEAEHVFGDAIPASNNAVLVAREAVLVAGGTGCLAGEAVPASGKVMKQILYRVTW